MTEYELVRAIRKAFMDVSRGGGLTFDGHGLASVWLHEPASVKDQWTYRQEPMSEGEDPDFIFRLQPHTEGAVITCRGYQVEVIERGAIH